MKRIVFALSMVFALLSCKEEAKFTLSGTLAGESEVDLVIGVIDSDGFQAIDTFKVVDGVVEYQMALSEPVMVHIFPSGQKKGILFFGDNTDYTINGDINKIVLAEISGGDIYNEYKIVSDISKNYSAKTQEYVAYRKSARSKDADKSKLAELQKEAEIAFEDYKKNIHEFIISHPASPVAAYYAIQYYKRKPLQEMKDALSALDKSLAGTMYYDGFADYILTQERVMVGALAPDFTMNDVDGKPFTLSSLRGNYVLIDFWASWCGPCRKENPNVVKLYEQYKDKGFEILGVSLDKDKEKWIQAISDDNLSWKHVSDLNYWDSDIVKLYAVSGVPHTVLLDKDGKIVAKNLRGEALHQKISELINQHD